MWLKIPTRKTTGPAPFVNQTRDCSSQLEVKILPSKKWVVAWPIVHDVVYVVFFVVVVVHDQPGQRVCYLSSDGKIGSHIDGKSTCKDKHTLLGCVCLYPGLHKLWQPGSLAARKWRENGEMEGDSLSTFLHFLFISSLSIHFLYQSQMSQKT